MFSAKLYKQRWYVQPVGIVRTMPFKSEAQRKWMYANKPEMAKRWEKHTPKGKKLPKKKTRTESTNFTFDNRLDEALNKLLSQ